MRLFSLASCAFSIFNKIARFKYFPITAKLNDPQHDRNKMRFNKICLASILTGLSLTACTTTTIHPNTPVVLEQHKNIQAEPNTKNNQARLIQQKDNCVIEFTGNFEMGQATEYWIFKGDQLLSAYTRIHADTEQFQNVFDVHNAVQQQNFKILQKNFKKSNLAKCS